MAGQDIDRRLLILAMVAIALFTVTRAVFALKGTDMFGDTDDVMRLVTARDFLHGQAFNDAFQTRDNTPFGSLMHWPRLVDVPLAALMALAAPLGNVGATLFAQIAWPSLLLVALLWLTYLLGKRFAGPAAALPSLILPLLAVPVLTEFAPGRVDHHNLQMVLMAALLFCVLEGRQRRTAAAGAGLIAALSLTVGLETLPLVMVAVGIVALQLVVEPQRAYGSAPAFAAGLMAGSVVLFAATTRPQDFATSACDVLSIVYVVAGLLAGAVVLMSAALLPRLVDWRLRLLVVGGLGLIAMTVLAFLFPQCLAGPYAQLDPVLARTMFPHIPEAQSALVRLRETPSSAIGILAVPLVGLVVTLWRAWRTRGAAQVDWVILLAFALAAIAVSLIQVRGARLATVFALPACIWLTTAAWTQLKVRNDMLAALGVAAAWLMSAGIVQLALAGPLQIFAVRSEVAASAQPASVCWDRTNYQALAALPASRVMTQSEIGAAVLLFTPDTVVATGYHRNSAGLADVVGFFNESPDKARAIAAKRGLQDLVLCQGLAATAGFVQRVNSEAGWTWLRLVTVPEAPILIYRIEPAAN